jgi:hypothetical protein
VLQALDCTGARSEARSGVFSLVDRDARSRRGVLLGRRLQVAAARVPAACSASEERDVAGSGLRNSLGERAARAAEGMPAPLAKVAVQDSLGICAPEDLQKLEAE